jgi:small-conductance mechanosensitive channel/CRP-like cAMP-binding protein
MTEVLDSSAALWAIAIIVLLPALIIGFGELSERLRRRSSPFQRAVATLRTWVLPLLAVWVLVVFALEADREGTAVRWLSTALLIALIAAGVQLARAFATVARGRSRTTGARPLPELLLLIPRLVVVLIGGWFLFVEVWNFDITGLAAALGIGSLVISLALQDTLSGLASGVLLVSDRPFSPGDWIRVGDLEGRVVDVRWRSSTIEDRNGDLVVVPNSNLAAENIVNFDRPSRLHRVVFPLQVAYSNAPTRAKEMLLAAAEGTPGVLDDPAPDVRVVQVDDPLMGYEVHLWIDDFTIAPQVASDFGSLVWYQSHRLDVPLPSPAFDLYHHDPIQEATDAALSTADLAERIRQAPLLSELDDGDTDRLAAASRAVAYSRGETIVAGDATSRDLFLIWRGLARVVAAGPGKESLGVMELGAGDVFGMPSRAAGLARRPDIVAVTDCEILVIDAEAASAVASRNPDLAKAVNQLAIARERRVERAQAASVTAGDGRPGATEPEGSDDVADEESS